MEPNNYITPRLGPRAIAVLVVAFLIVVGGWANRVWNPLQLGIWFQVADVGLIYGLFVGGCWLTTSVAHPIVRAASRIILIGAASIALAAYRISDDMLRYLVTFSGLMISQAIVFLLLQTSRWRYAKLVQPSKRQFGIIEILICTTAIAVLLALAKQLRVTVNPMEFWLVLVGIWIWFPLMSACACAAGLGQQPKKSAIWLVLGFAAAIAGALTIGYAERAVVPDPIDIVQLPFAKDLPFLSSLSPASAVIYALAFLYTAITIASFVVVLLLAVAGRWDAVAMDSQKQEEAETTGSVPTAS